MVRHAVFTFGVRVSASFDPRQKTRRSEGMIHPEPVAWNTAPQLREPRIFGDAWVVVSPQVGPAECGQPLKVLSAVKSLSDLIEPVRSSVEIADQHVWFRS